MNQVERPKSSRSFASFSPSNIPTPLSASTPTAAGFDPELMSFMKSSNNNITSLSDRILSPISSTTQAPPLHSSSASMWPNSEGLTSISENIPLPMKRSGAAAPTSPSICFSTNNINNANGVLSGVNTAVVVDQSDSMDQFDRMLSQRRLQQQGQSQPQLTPCGRSSIYTPAGTVTPSSFSPSGIFGSGNGFGSGISSFANTHVSSGSINFREDLNYASGGSGGSGINNSGNRGTSPMVMRAVQSAIADETKRRELKAQLAKLLQDVGRTGSLGGVEGGTAGGGKSYPNSSNSHTRSSSLTPRSSSTVNGGALHDPAAESIIKIAKTLRDISPLTFSQPPPPLSAGTASTAALQQHMSSILSMNGSINNLGNANNCGGCNNLINVDSFLSPRVPSAESQGKSSYSNNFINNISKILHPKPREKKSIPQLSQEQLAKREQPTKKKILRSATSAFSETEESSSLTSSTKSSKHIIP